VKRRIAKKILRNPWRYSITQKKSAERKYKQEIAFQKDLYDAGISALCEKSLTLNYLFREAGFLGVDVWRNFVSI
jgi:uncharacterized protein (DUF2225 family)